MFIRRFHIKNFKIHRDTALDLFPVTVFVGPNSGGKSAIFDALINFSMVCRGNLSEAFNQYPFSFEALRHHGASSAARIRYEAELALDPKSEESLHYSIEFSQNPGSYEEPTYAIHNEELRTGARLVFNRSDDFCELDGLTGLQYDGRSILAAVRRAEWPDDFESREPLVAHCAREISRIGRYRLDPTLLARPGRVFDVEPGEPEVVVEVRLLYDAIETDPRIIDIRPEVLAEWTGQTQQHAHDADVVHRPNSGEVRITIVRNEPIESGERDR